MERSTGCHDRQSKHYYRRRFGDKIQCRRWIELSFKKSILGYIVIGKYTISGECTRKKHELSLKKSIHFIIGEYIVTGEYTSQCEK
jgi:hypothetical protein